MNNGAGSLFLLQGTFSTQESNRALLNYLGFYAEYIMQNARLDESQAGNKAAGENINNLRYSDDTTLMAESKEELKSLLMKVKVENEKDGLKLNIQKLRSLSHHFIVNRWGKNGNSAKIYFPRLQKHCVW